MDHLGNQPQTRKINQWIVRQSTPIAAEAGTPEHIQFPVLLLLHGWTGDENVMWIFTTRLTSRYLIIAPRAPYPTPHGGYSWHPARSGWPGVNDFRPAVSWLNELLATDNFPNADFSQLHVMGFSQGAALTYIFALLSPERVTSFIGLSGFLPEDVEGLVDKKPLSGKLAFIAHGTQDEWVSIAQARWAVDRLQVAGAEVTYCEADVGHKLGVDCFRAVETFLSS